jgi:hypothetical protein
VSQLLITFQISTTFAGDLMTAIGPIMGKITDIEFEMVTVREPVPVAKTVRNTMSRHPFGNGVRGCDAALIMAFKGPASSINTEQAGVALVASGYSATSISPTVSRLAKQGYVARKGGGMYEITDAGWEASRSISREMESMEARK